MIFPGVGKHIFPAFCPGVTQTLAIGAASTATGAAIGASLVMVVSTAACYLAFGTNTPTATSSSFFLPANTPMYLTIGANWFIAALEATGAGTLYITPAQ